MADGISAVQFHKGRNRAPESELVRRFQPGSTANHCMNFSYTRYPVRDRTEETLGDRGHQGD